MGDGGVIGGVNMGDVSTHWIPALEAWFLLLGCVYFVIEIMDTLFFWSKDK